MSGRAARTQLRLVFVLLGAALALAFALLDATLIALLLERTATPTWAVVLLGTLVVLLPVVALGLLPVMRSIQGAAVAALLGVDLPGGPPGPAGTWSQRWRTLGWLVLHLLAGAVLVVGVTLAIAGGLRWWGLAALLATGVGAVALGEGLVRVAPRLLGPTLTERLALLERDVDRAVERNRIAREIHDSVGHALSLVSVQAGAARKVIDRDPAFAVSALAAIEQAARAATADLDHVLGLLREDGDTRGASPPRGLDALDALVAATRAAGLEVTCTVTGDLAGLPALVDREAYRIVQEALTNGLRHTADGAAELTVERTADAVVVSVRNRARPSGAAAQHGGRTGSGLRGAAERVRTLGGSFRAGPLGPAGRPDAAGTWELVARLPLAPGAR